MPILNSINLTNVNQVIVTSSKTNVTRSYGRRFTVSDGTTTQEVVLKDLFKKARKLARKASTTEELEKVEAFTAAPARKEV